jgi:hypothetical protein
MADWRPQNKQKINREADNKNKTPFPEVASTDLWWVGELLKHF